MQNNLTSYFFSQVFYIVNVSNLIKYLTVKQYLTVGLQSEVLKGISLLHFLKGIKNFATQWLELNVELC